PVAATAAMSQRGSPSRASAGERSAGRGVGISEFRPASVGSGRNDASSLRVTPRVRVIVLNFNGGDMVHRAIASVLESRWPAEALDVVLVDNASTDGSADRIAADFPSVRLIRSPRNRGFPANNLAMGDLAGVDHVALVNPDAFVDPDWLSPLV